MTRLGPQIEALKRDPASAEAAEAVRSAARETGAFRDYAEAFADRGESLEARGETPGAIEAWLEAALVYEENVGELDRASHLYERVLEVDPTHRRALFALGLVLHDQQRWDDLVELYRRRLQQVTDEAERTTLLQYIAELLAEKKDDPNGAFEALVAAAARAPWNLRILSRLEKLGERTDRVDEVAITIGDMLMHQEDPHVRAALSLRLAEMYLGPLADSARALAHLRSALADDGGNPEVLGEIEDVFRERSRFDELAEFLEEVIQEGRLGPHRVRLERELAHIYEHELDDHARALAALTRALESVPDDRELIDEVMRLGSTGGDLGAVARTYERVVARTENPLLATYLRLKLGHIYANVLERKEDALRVYRSILDAEPEHDEASRRIERLLARYEMTERAGRQAGAEPSSQAAEEVEAEVEARPTGDVNAKSMDLPTEPSSEDEPEEIAEPEATDGAMRRPSGGFEAPTDRPGEPGADGAPGGEEQEALSSSEGAGRWEEASSEGRIHEAVDEALHLVAEVERLKTLDAPAEGRAVPGSGADEGDALAAERPERAATETSAEASSGVARAEPAQRLDGSNGEHVDPAEVLRLAELMPVASFRPPEEVDDLDLSGDLIDMPAPRAGSGSAEAREGDSARPPPPGSGSLETHDLDHVEELDVGLIIFGEAAEAETEASPERLESSIELLEGPERTERRLEAAGAWRKAGNLERAEALLRAGLLERAGDPALLTALADLLEARGDWPSWMATAERMLESEPLRHLSSAVRVRMMQVASEQLGDPRLAWRLGEEAAEASPEDPRPLVLLEALAREASDKVALADVLARLVVLRPLDPDAHRALGLTLIEAGRLDEARSALLEALRLAPEDEETRWALADVDAELGDLESAGERFWGLSRAGPPERRALALARLAELLLPHPERHEDGKRALSEALEVDPDCREALQLACDEAERSGDPAGASALAERCAERESAPITQAAWLRRGAELADRGVGDTRRAIRLYKASLLLDPDDPEVEARLGALLLERSEPHEAQEHFRRAAEGLRDEERAAELYELAGIAAERAGTAEAALAAYERALERSGTRRHALLRASALHADAGAPDRAYDRAALLILHHEDALSPSERAEAFSRMARSKQAFGDRDAAVRLARRAEGAARDDPEVLSLLAEVLEQAGELEEASEALRRLAARSSPGPERASGLARAARQLPGRSPADRARRVALLEEALSESPTDVTLAEALAEAKGGLGDADGEALALEHGASHAEGTRKAELLVRAAAVVRLTDLERATVDLEAAVEADVAHVAAVEALEVIWARRGRQEARLALLERAARACGPTEQGRLFRERAARVAESWLQRPEAALELLEGFEEGTARVADLAYRRAVERKEAVEPARRAWAARAAARPADRLALDRLAELHLLAGDDAAARFVLEMGVILHDADLRADAPSPAASQASLEVPPDPGETDAEDAQLMVGLGYAPLEGLRDELPEPRPRRRDALGPAALGIRTSRPLDDACRALGVPVPTAYLFEDAARPIEAAWSAGGPCILVAPKRAETLDEASMRYFAGRALSLLRPSALALHLLAPEILRSVAYGLAGRDPMEGDPVSFKLAKRRARAVEKQVAPAARAKLQAIAGAWVSRPRRRSLLEARAAAERTASRAGLLASGSPLVALRLVSDVPSADRSRLARFAVQAMEIVGFSRRGG